MPPPRRPMVRPAPDLLARPAVCGHPTSMILTRAHRSSDLLRKRASPGGYFTRALCAGSQNHAGPANLLSCASRLSGLYASLRPSARPRVRFGLARAPHEPPTSISPSRRMSAKRMLWQGCGYRRGSIPRYDAGTPLLLNNHAPTILRVEYTNDTISTQPSYISEKCRFALASQSHDMVQYVSAMAKAKVTGRRRGLR